jgi:hypothetical protein
MSVKLEVNKSYRNRLGEVVTIIREAGLGTHRFTGSDGEVYRYNGRVGFFKNTDLDLIEETTKLDTMRPGPWGNFIAGMFDGSYRKVA